MSGPEEAAAAAEVLEGGQLTMGEKVAELEEELARACGVEHAVAVSSGTAALHLAVLALGIGEGDEVLVPAYTFPATANVVALAGARPVLVDVDPKTMNLDPGRVYDAVTPRTRAVLAVHLFGRPLDWEELQNAVPPDVHLVEDAAGALGARWRGMPCGGLGELGCLSFHPRKIVSTGEGGAVTTNVGDYADCDSPAPPSRDLDRRRLRHPRARLQLPPLGRPLRHRPRPDAPPGGAVGGAPPSGEGVYGAAGGRRRDPGAGEGGQARVAGLRRPARPARPGARGAARGRDRGADRDIRRPPPHAPTATRGRFRAPTRATSARSRCPSTRASPSADLDRVAEVLDKVVSE